MISKSSSSPPPSLHVTLADVATSAHAPLEGLLRPAETSLPESHPLNVAARASRAAGGVDASLLKLVNDVACSANRMRAAEAMVRHFANQFPGASVRCAIGARQLRRMYDRRLGWLGQQSLLRIEAEDRWLTIIQDESTKSDDAGIAIRLAEPDGDGQFVIWVSGEGVPAETQNKFEYVRNLVGNVFWRRPRVSTPQVLSQIGARAKFWTTVAVVAAAVIALFPIRYPVDCTAKVEAVHQRLISAPFEATLLESNVRPGESVRQGQSLAVLDGRPLRLEVESTESEMHQVSKEHNVALASGRIAEAQQLSLQRRRLARRIDLLSDRLGRLTVISPIDGVVVSGDLGKFVGASLEIGQTIFEVAPLESMSIEVEIPEYEIGLVDSDAMTRVRIGAIGGPSIRQPLSNLYPAAEVREDRNVFVGRIVVDNSEGKLRPGMRGDATVYGPLRPLAWSWVRGGWERMLWWLGY